jgi:hypothetical protein
MSKFRSLVAFGLLFIFAMPAFAWNDTGHKLTAYIAWQKMTPKARENAAMLLANAPEDSDLSVFFPGDSRSVGARRLEHFMIAATWADIVRADKMPVRRAKYHKGNWHYSDIFFREINGKPVIATDLKDAPENAIERLYVMKAILGDTTKTDAERAIALAWVEHLVGDIHQPLHSVARVTELEPRGDQGGNLFELTPKDTPKENRENLHWFWDSIVSNTEPRVNDACDADYIAKLGNEFMKKFPESKMTTQVADMKIEDWRQEGFENSVKYVYAGLQRYQKPSAKYQKEGYKLAQQEIALAGYRMAAILNQALGK